MAHSPDHQDTILARLDTSPVRHGFSVIMLFLLGGVLIWLGLTRPSLMSLVTLSLGAASLWAGESLRRSGRLAILLTTAGLQDSTGRSIAVWHEIAGMQRGPFAAKPSGGFVLLMHRKQKRGWVPGLWWRFGRRVGVGGMTHSSAGRFMADSIELRLAGFKAPLEDDH